MSPLLGFGDGLGEIVITDSYCNGSEKTLAECSRNVVGGNKCENTYYESYASQVMLLTVAREAKYNIDLSIRDIATT